MTFELNLIDISQLFLDLKNPRLESVENQREAITEMIDTQGDKLVRLGKDIIKYGLNPCDSLAVVPSGDFFTVLEGNRRITAIKLLKQPELAKEAQELKIFKAFEKLSREFDENSFNEITCVVFENRESAHHWIVLKHTGENDGMGTVGWGSVEKDRFNYLTGEGEKQPHFLQLRDFVETHAPGLLPVMKSSKKINIIRIIKSKFGRDFLGLTLENGNLGYIIDPKEITKALTKIFSDSSSGRLKVKDIYDNDDIKRYLSSFPTENTPRKVPPNSDGNNTNHNKSSSAGSQHGSQSSGSNNSQHSNRNGNSSGTTLANNSKRKGSKQDSAMRQYLISSGCILTITNPRINSMYKEMKGKIKVEDAPNCMAIMLRVFIELSFEWYIKQNPSISDQPSEKLGKKIAKALQYMKMNDAITENEAKIVDVAISDRNRIFSVNTLHAYIHNADFNPIGRDLKIIWNNWEPVLKAIWK